MQILGEALTFLLFAGLACGFAIAVALGRNIVRMAFYLVGSLGAVAGLYFLAGAIFLGVVQLLIYVGGTMVLLVFGLMLTSGGPQITLRISRTQWLTAAIGCGLLLGLLVWAALSVNQWTQPIASTQTGSAQLVPETSRLGLALVGVRAEQVAGEHSAGAAGLMGYLLAFEIVSIHLLAVLIGAAYLARPRRPLPPESEPS